MKGKVETWQTYIEGQHKPKGKTRNLEHFVLWGPKWGMENAV